MHITTTTDEFVNVKAGQGYREYNFGPELGLASYLSETYPDETFYIIKYAIGGTGLNAHWNPDDPEKATCLNAFYETVDEGLALLEDEGYDPRIVAFLWMQGESDASVANRSYNYYTLQKHLVEQNRNRYAFYASIRDIAFIDAAISDSGFWANWFLLNEMKRAYSEESPKNFFIFASDIGALPSTGTTPQRSELRFSSISLFIFLVLYVQLRISSLFSPCAILFTFISVYSSNF